jgi:hypothetical protein
MVCWFVFVFCVRNTDMFQLCFEGRSVRTFEALDIDEKKAEHASCMMKLLLPYIPASTTAFIEPFAAKAPHTLAPDAA